MFSWTLVTNLVTVLTPLGCSRIFALIGLGRNKPEQTILRAIRKWWGWSGRNIVSAGWPSSRSFTETREWKSGPAVFRKHFLEHTFVPGSVLRLGTKANMTGSLHYPSWSTDKWRKENSHHLAHEKYIKVFKCYKNGTIIISVGCMLVFSLEKENTSLITNKLCKKEKEKYIYKG